MIRSEDLKGAASWIWHPEESSERRDFVLFYGTLLPPENATEIELHVSADSRYILYADTGEGVHRVGRGPARADPVHTPLDPYRLTNIRRGDPVRLWAQVRWGATTFDNAYAEMHTASPGFLVIALFREGRGNLLRRGGTGVDWLAYRSRGITTLHTLRGVPWSQFIGGTESHDSRGWPKDWCSADGASESGGWQKAVAHHPAYFKGDPPYPADFHFLVPREIRQPYETSGDFAQMTILDASGALIPLTLPVHLHPHQTMHVLLDAGTENIAYPIVSLHGGGSKVQLTYAEVLRDRQNQKVFHLVPGAQARGYSDTFSLTAPTPDASHTFEPFHWRAFRFIQMDITAGPHGATVDAGYRRTSYFSDNYFQMNCEGPQHDVVRDIVDVSWRTLQCCSWETYMDCPYYEQLQYVGDTRLQALCSYVSSGDTSLAVQALRAFDRSRTHEGLTCSRYPSADLQLIPTFSLLYILMIEDYWQFTRDATLLAELEAGIAGILHWFERHVDPQNGLLGRIPYWPFVDWVQGWNEGVPPGTTSALVNLHYLLALKSAARIKNVLCDGAGRIYHEQAATLRQRIYKTFYDPAAQLLSDVPVLDKSSCYSQHGQALAVLADVLTGAEARIAMQGCMASCGQTKAGAFSGTEGALTDRRSNPPIAQASIYFSFYLGEAIAKLQMGELFWPLLKTHRDALARGSTTWPESPEPSRSECHAWGSWPIYFFARYVLGVQSSDERTGQVTVRPVYCPPLDQVSGVVPTRDGLMHVKVRWQNGQADIATEKIPFLNP